MAGVAHSPNTHGNRPIKIPYGYARYFKIHQVCWTTRLYLQHAMRWLCRFAVILCLA